MLRCRDAVAVLAGALLVGDSVRGSLRISSCSDWETRTRYNVHRLLPRAARRRHSKSRTIPAGGLPHPPLLPLKAQSLTKRASAWFRCSRPAVDERFWKFHGRENRAPINREILVSEALARELGSNPGDALLLRVEKPSEIPVESLHSKKEDLGRTLRLTLREVLVSDGLGEFSIQPQQSETRAVFVPLNLLQKELEQNSKVNLILIDGNFVSEVESGAQTRKIEVLRPILKETASLEDYGIKLRDLNEQQMLSIESSAGFIPEELAKGVETAAQSADLSGAWPFLSYLINGIRRDDGREIPYSIVTGVDSKLLESIQRDERGYFSGCDSGLPAIVGSVPATEHLPPITLNDWAASDLQVKLGDRVTLDYYVWLEAGKLDTAAAFRVACIIPMKGPASNHDLVPGPAFSRKRSAVGSAVSDRLKRVRPQDEDYWKKYARHRGFIPLKVGRLGKHGSATHCSAPQSQSDTRTSASNL